MYSISYVLGDSADNVVVEPDDDDDYRISYSIMDMGYYSRTFVLVILFVAVLQVVYYY